MRVLIACERSGIIRDAFLALGHDALSCDLEPTRRSGPHYQGDVRDILGDAWDLMIAHPVCRYLSNSGAKHLYNGMKLSGGRNPERWRLMEDGAAFYNLFRDADHIRQRAIENPIMHRHARALIGHEPRTQFVQPWMFGDNFTKATGFQLFGLPPLIPTHTRGDYDVPAVAECHLMAPGPDREEKRSQTYPGIARACAEQWGI